jgi:flagellar protein FliO/FliZ
MTITNDPATWPLAVLALLGVLGLILLLARGARSLGLGGTGPRPGRRLGLQEVLPLDGRRRLVLVRCDGREALMLTGGGQDVVVGWLPAPAEEGR